MTTQTISAGSPVTLRAGWREMFATEAEAVVFARVAVGDRFEESRVRVRPLGALCVPVMLRTGNEGVADAAAFEAAFGERRGLPPFCLPRGARVLDLGCGAGHSCAALAARDPLMRVLGVEMDAGSAAFAAEAVGEFVGRVRVMHGAAWGETGSVACGGTHPHYSVWSSRVVQLDAYPGMEPVRARGTVAAYAMGALLDACAGAGGYVDHVHMDIAGSEAAVFDQPAKWLTGRVGSIRVHVSAPAKREKIESRLVEQGLIVRLDPRDDMVVTGMTRAFAAGQARFARDAGVIEAPPPPY